MSWLQISRRFMTGKLQYDLFVRLLKRYNGSLALPWRGWTLRDVLVHAAFAYSLHRVTEAAWSQCLDALADRPCPAGEVIF